MRRILSTAVLLYFSSTFTFSQTTSTTILGTVSDGSGALVAGAKVVATNINTGIKRTDTTTATGDYAFPLLDVGQFSVTVEMKGFKTETQKGLELQINQKARVDFKLEVGSQTETVTITGEVAALKTDEASLGSVVEQRRVVELPLNGRNLAGLAVMQPGVQFGGDRNRLARDRHAAATTGQSIEAHASTKLHARLHHSKTCKVASIERQFNHTPLFHH